MGQEYSLIVLLAWLPQAIGQTLNWIYWWQTKEYRIDRFRLLFSSGEGRRSLGLGFIAAKLIVLAGTYFWSNLLALFGLFLFLNGKLLFDLVEKRLRKPVFTLRAIELFLTGVFTILLVIFLVFGGFSNFALLIIIGELLLIICPLAGIIWTAPLVFITKVRQIKKAKSRLLQINPFVIGVTGSYGKTTTKEFIAHILSQKYKTVRTRDHENTEFGVARRASSLPVGTEVFVVEMGAYKEGEVRRLTDIVRPKVGVITGIEPQHVALFGNLEAVKKTKYELIESLPDGALALFAWSNRHCRDMARWAKRSGYKVAGYGVGVRTDFTSSVLSASSNGVKFEVSDGKTSHVFFTPVHGIHFSENLTGAILVARSMKVNWQKIKQAVKTISKVMPERTMGVTNVRGGIVVDDSYNATPAGLGAALDYLALFGNRKKVVVTAGMIELGEFSESVHKSLGVKAASMVDLFLLTNTDFVKPLTNGFGKQSSKIRVISDPFVLARTVVQLLKEGYVVLLEGRLPATLNTFVKHKAT